MKMSTQNLRLFREDFTNEMKKLEEKYHITIKLGDIRYSEEDFTAKLTATNQTAVKTPKEQFEEDAKYFRDFGVMPNMYGKIFRGMDSGLFRLVGLRPNARKNIFTVLRLEDGKQYVCDPFFLKLEKDDPYEKMIEYILHQATEQDFLDFMGYDQRPVDRKDVEEVLAQMPESEFQKLYREFGLDTLCKENL